MSAQEAAEELIYVCGDCTGSDACNADDGSARIVWEQRLFAKHLYMREAFDVVLWKHMLELIIALFLSPSFVYCAGHGHWGGAIYPTESVHPLSTFPHSSCWHQRSYFCEMEKNG